jgi:Protein of unknown function (DUF1569)
MKPAPLTKSTFVDFQIRLENISPSQKPVFGTLLPADLMVHLTKVLDIASGVGPEVKAGNFFTRTRIMQWIIIDGPAWPKGKIKGPNSLTPKSEKPFLEARLDLYKAMERFVAFYEDQNAKVSPHPIFGKLTKDQWARFQGKHLDHHLQQYDV